MLEDFWNGILELTAQFVIPDWGALIALLPVLIFAASVVVIVADAVRSSSGRRSPAAASTGSSRSPPPGIHMPGPSLAPVFAAIGAFLLFLGLVFGGAGARPRRDRASR